jgi:hypothetical protein
MLRTAPASSSPGAPGERHPAPAPRLKRRPAHKKISAAALTHDGRHVVYADKFGDVCIATTRPAAVQQQQQQQQLKEEQQQGHEQPQVKEEQQQQLKEEQRQVKEEEEQQQQQRQQAGQEDGGPPAAEDPAPLLGHLQSIVAAALVLPGDRLVVTADRDSKVRVSVLQRPEPLLGSYEIQAYCLGHREFVAAAAAVPPPPFAAASGPAGGALLLTGGGEGAVKLWDPVTGQQLASYAAVTDEEAATAAPAEGAEGEAAAPGRGPGPADDGGADGDGGEDGAQDGSGGGAGGADGAAAAGTEGEGGGGEGEGGRRQPWRRKERKRLLPVVGVAVSPCGGLAAVLVEGLRHVQLLKVDAAARALGPCVQRLALPPGVLAPCRAAFDDSGRLWLVGGPPVVVTTSAHVAVAQPADGGSGERQRGRGGPHCPCA